MEAVSSDDSFSELMNQEGCHCRRCVTKAEVQAVLNMDWPPGDEYPIGYRYCQVCEIEVPENLFEENGSSLSLVYCREHFLEQERDHMKSSKPLPTDRKVAIFKMPTKSHQPVGLETVISITAAVEELLLVSPRLKVWRDGNWISVYGPSKYDDTVEDHLTAVLRRFGTVDNRIEWIEWRD